MFIHVVFFWIPPAAPASARMQLAEDCRTMLAKIPTLTSIEVGRPAMTPRDVVDNSYDVALLTTFADSAGHDVYQTHPLHLEFIARNKGTFGRVQIYDFDTAPAAVL